MKLKCIGGDCDGQLVDVDSRLQNYDWVKVFYRTNYKVTDFNPNIEDIIVNTAATYRMYKIAELVFTDGKFLEKTRFLIPDDSYVNEAVKLMVDKYGT